MQNPLINNYMACYYIMASANLGFGDRIIWVKF